MEDKKNYKPNFLSFKFVKNDLISGLVVFLVALPLCLGIALASGAPLISGLITGIVAGLLVAVLSGSQLAVSGPAAGLTIIVLDAIERLGSYQAFLLAIVFAGIIQIILGYAKAGIIGNYFPSSVIKGMLAAIGIILILKQIPHAFGYDADYEGDFSFKQPDHENTFTELVNTVNKFSIAAIIISIVSITILILWETKYFKKLRAIPGPLVVVVFGILANYLLSITGWFAALQDNHLVTIPIAKTFGDLKSFFTFPDFSQLGNSAVYVTALTLAIVASLETLLSVEAIDKLDPYKRLSPPNRELKAQGVGNIIAGLLGGLPMTAVIVRGATNVNSGAVTKTSAFFHGVFLLVAVLIIPSVINLIPLASLAAILLTVGYKLTKKALYLEMYKAGWNQFVPFMITIIAIVFTDLLIGVSIGLVAGFAFILRANFQKSYSFEKKSGPTGERIKIQLGENVSFLNKSKIVDKLYNLPENSFVEIDASNTHYIDHDVLEVIENFKTIAEERNIQFQFIQKEETYLQDITLDNNVAPTSSKSYQQLFTNNRNWVKEKLSLDPHYFEKMALGQSPKFLWIGCSDSRVQATDITGVDPGEMFVHRNVANLVINTDLNLLSVLQYAVEVLKVEHVIVCGHYGCGGVKAAMQHDNLGLINKWLRNIKDVYRLHNKELSAIQNESDRFKRLVELNVVEQVFNLYKTSIIQKAWRDDEVKVHVHGWVYDLKDGLIKDLDVDIQNAFSEYDEIYKFKTKPKGVQAQEKVTLSKYFAK